MKAHPVMLSFALIMVYSPGYSQQGRNVLWSTRIERISLHEANLVISARIQPGWHLYSQHLKEEGPQPTRITFTQDNRYALSGFVEEGEPHTYYEDIYEMDVTWYSNKVDFVSKLKLSEPVIQLNGVVEYMTCNLQMCVPEKIAIAVQVDLTKQVP
jgi:DsbC/DsbD-like thiol-disulfide interchange protein